MSEEKVYPQEQVWAAAVAAQRINGGYFKREKIVYFVNHHKWGNTASNKSNKLSNISLVRSILQSDQSNITPEDFIEGQKIREYFCGLISLVFTGEARNFLKLAACAAGQKEFSLFEKNFPLIVSLPDAYAKNIARAKVRETLAIVENESSPYVASKLNHIFNDVITVLDCKYNKRFINPYAVNAITISSNENKSLVYFYDCREWKVGKKKK